MSMVGTLLDFIRSLQEGNWSHHLESFAAMLPWMTIYDHHHYGKWGAVYLADMHKLKDDAPEVYSEFVFNQIPVDQGTEWVSKICKVSDGIISLTRKYDTARDRFYTTWSKLEAYISWKMRTMKEIMLERIERTFHPEKLRMRMLCRNWSISLYVFECLGSTLGMVKNQMSSFQSQQRMLVHLRDTK